MVDFTEGPHSAEVYDPLEPQWALTLELGTRGEHGRFQWELSLYHSWLHNELLELNDAQGNDLGDINVNTPIIRELNQVWTSNCEACLFPKEKQRI
jgi:hypothetical protein